MKLTQFGVGCYIIIGMVLMFFLFSLLTNEFDNKAREIKNPIPKFKVGDYVKSTRFREQWEEPPFIYIIKHVGIGSYGMHWCEESDQRDEDPCAYFEHISLMRTISISFVNSSFKKVKCPKNTE